MKKIIALSLSLIFVFSGCSQKKKIPVSHTDFFLNTVSSLKIYDMDEEEAMSIILECFQYCKEYEKILSKTIEGSDVWRINESAGQWVDVDNATIELLNLSKKYSQLSSGAFDITVEPLSALWDFQSNSPSVPDANIIKKLLPLVNWESIEIDRNKVRLLDSDSSIDFGGVGKGYIGDIAKAFLLDKEVTKAIVDFGGNVLTINPNEEDTFNIGIARPFYKENQNPIYGVVTINNQTVVTSGTYERYFIENDTIYHHILDTKTGYPINNQLYSVTIITENSAIADCLSTTCFALGLEDGLAVAESIEGVEAIFIDNNYDYYATSGIGSKIKFVKN